LLKAQGGPTRPPNVSSGGGGASNVQAGGSSGPKGGSGPREGGVPLGGQTAKGAGTGGRCLSRGGPNRVFCGNGRGTAGTTGRAGPGGTGFAGGISVLGLRGGRYRLEGGDSRGGVGETRAEAGLTLSVRAGGKPQDSLRAGNFRGGGGTVKAARVGETAKAGRQRRKDRLAAGGGAKPAKRGHGIVPAGKAFSLPGARATGADQMFYRNSGRGTCFGVDSGRPGQGNIQAANAFPAGRCGDRANTSLAWGAASQFAGGTGGFPSRGGRLEEIFLSGGAKGPGGPCPGKPKIFPGGVRASHFRGFSGAGGGRTTQHFLGGNGTRGDTRLLRWLGRRADAKRGDRSSGRGQPPTGKFVISGIRGTPKARDFRQQKGRFSFPQNRGPIFRGTGGKNRARPRGGGGGGGTDHERGGAAHRGRPSFFWEGRGYRRKRGHGLIMGPAGPKPRLGTIFRRGGNRQRCRFIQGGHFSGGRAGHLRRSFSTGPPAGFPGGRPHGVPGPSFSGGRVITSFRIFFCPPAGHPRLRQGRARRGSVGDAGPSRGKKLVCWW